MTDEPFDLEALTGGPLERNALRCLDCDTVIESFHRHDFRTCECGKVCVDGGLDYARVVFAPDARYERLGPE